jgi:putative ABC transport system permease protein
MRDLLAAARSLLRGVRQGRSLDADMEAEFRHHVESRAADLMDEGYPAREAKRLARLEFGATERYREEGRAARGLLRLDEIRTDLRFSARSLRRSPGFALGAIVLLALGVGANAAVFSLISAHLLRPLPFPDSGRLVLVHQTYAPAASAARPLPWSYPEYDAVRRAAGGFAGLAAYTPASVNVSLGDETFRTSAEVVSASYLATLGLRPARGRDFLEGEDVTGADPVAMLSHDLWQRHLGEAADASLRNIVVNGLPFTVVGVAPPGFRGLTGDADIWLTHAMAPAVYFDGYLTSDQRFLSVVGRLARGSTLEQAGAELGSAGVRAAAAARATMPGSEWSGEWGAAAVPLDVARQDPATLRAHLMLSAAVFFILLMALVNVFALLLARSTVRARETAVRGALGAGRWRIVRHGAVEGGLLGVLGGALGILLAVWVVRLLAMLAPEHMDTAQHRLGNLSSFAEPGVDWRVIVFSVVLSIGAGVVAGVLPVIRATRGDFVRDLKAGARGTSLEVGSVRRPTVLSAAAIVQIACALVLLAGAGALMQSFQRLIAIDPGFDPAGVVTFRINPPDHIYGGAAAAPLLERLLHRVEAVPGVQSATVGLCTPYMQCSTTTVFIQGRDDGQSAGAVGRHYVGPDHFSTLGIRLLRGRVLTDSDREDQPRVAVINETAAQQFWPDQDPVGQVVWFSSGGGFASQESPTEIVGVVADVLYGRPGESVRPDFYTSYHQFTWPHTTVMVKAGAGDPLALVPALRQAVLDVDPQLPIHDVRSLANRSAEALAGERFAARALAVSGVLGLLLAALGVYGIMAYSVAQRRREVGIRLALGSSPRDVLRVVMGQGAGLLAAGLLIGTVLALWLSRALPAFITGVSGADAGVLAAVASLLAIVGLVACWLPARSAMRVNPAETLSGE